MNHLSFVAQDMDARMEGVDAIGGEDYAGKGYAVWICASTGEELATGMRMIDE
ncbi:MAG: hypothetical protein WBY53_09260 [Acidobacteriaceae bacterium]